MKGEKKINHEDLYAYSEERNLMPFMANWVEFSSNLVTMSELKLTIKEVMSNKYRKCLTF